jgi:hypothetical protein
MATVMAQLGIDVVGDMVAWGAHFCLFYETKEDLLDTLISYCRTAELDWNAVSTASGLLRSP